MLEPFGPEIWISAGPEADVAGFRYPTRMAVIRLSGGSLMIWSPVALTEPLKAAVEALGTVRHIVPPNSLHHLHVADWQAVYPKATTYAPPGLRKKRPDLAFQADLAEGLHPWAGEVDQVVFEGNAITAEVVFFHRASQTAIFTDLLQQFPRGWFTGWRALVAKLDHMTDPEPAVPQKFRLAFIGRRQARAALQAILTWPAEKVLMAHGQPIQHDGQDFIRRAFRWL
ncbi:hypothetical protein QO010_000909 [Caulobacter ginsengisoli]|uniref:DUF4336 domain-containing protein n=1 Tax=Caulobacter ginsengisoli TaxID=400775 RepID=A0ABU0IMC3_9CAUL|nr:DUF4336 domain-containing protein [Caulobacter ginsengisoli]MDQ0463161.1 hypothetical protein [Caulobacter ginsengisoli]